MGGGSVMVWAAFGFNGKTRICFFEGSLNAERYCQMLDEYLYPSISSLANYPQVFQQDNAPCHTARVTKALLKSKGSWVDDWPARSPDLNPIENLWAILVQEVYKGGRQFDSKEALKRAIMTAWDQIPHQTLQDLITSMPNRVFEVLNAKGNSIYDY